MDTLRKTKTDNARINTRQAFSYMDAWTSIFSRHRQRHSSGMPSMPSWRRPPALGCGARPCGRGRNQPACSIAVVSITPSVPPRGACGARSGPGSCGHTVARHRPIPARWRPMPPHRPAAGTGRAIRPAASRAAARWRRTQRRAFQPDAYNSNAPAAASYRLSGAVSSMPAVWPRRHRHVAAGDETSVTLPATLHGSSNNPSCLRKQASSDFQAFEKPRHWVPACAGMTSKSRFLEVPFSRSGTRPARDGAG